MLHLVLIIAQNSKCSTWYPINLGFFFGLIYFYPKITNRQTFKTARQQDINFILTIEINFFFI